MDMEGAAGERGSPAMEACGDRLQDKIASREAPAIVDTGNALNGSRDPKVTRI